MLDQTLDLIINTRISDAQTTCDVEWMGRIRCSNSNNRSPIRSPICHNLHHFAHQFAHQSSSYHMRPQISHLTVLKFAHQFAPSGCSFDCTDPACHRNLASHIREIARKCDITSQQVAQLALKCQLILARKSSNKPLIPRNKLLNHTVLSSDMSNGSHRRCSKPREIAHTYPGRFLDLLTLNLYKYAQFH